MTVRQLTLVAALAGLTGLLIGLVFDPKTALASYLVAWVALSAVPVGALAVLLTTYLVRGGWTHDLHASLSGAALTIPAIAALFVPILLGMANLYPWVSDTVHLPPFKATYLTPWFFVLRATFYFAAWTALAVWASRAYGDDTAMKRVASAGLVVWALTTSWSGIDWLESLEPKFHSSIYGLLVIGFQLLAALSFAIVALLLGKRTRQMANTAYAGTLLSVLLLWAYLHAMQYIIIWSGNIPDETIWYITRLEGNWAFALWALFILQFVLPFFALLSVRVRGSTNALLWIAGATLGLRYLEAAVLIFPPLQLNTAVLWLALPAAILLTGAAWLFAWHAVAEWLQTRFSGRTATIR